MNATENQRLLVHQSQPITMSHLKIESDYKTAEVEIVLELSMQEKLARAIDKEGNSKISSKCNEYQRVCNEIKVPKKWSSTACYTFLAWTAAN
jgi:hypothetical protein